MSRPSPPSWSHAQASPTMDIYTHALRENDRQAVDSLEPLLSGDDA